MTVTGWVSAGKMIYAGVVVVAGSGAAGVVVVAGSGAAGRMTFFA